MENKKVDFETAVKHLNQICEGLGDALNDNAVTTALKGLKTLSGWIVGSVSWSDTPEGLNAWLDMYYLISQMTKDLWL